MAEESKGARPRLGLAGRQAPKPEVPAAPAGAPAVGAAPQMRESPLESPAPPRHGDEGDPVREGRKNKTGDRMADSRQSLQDAFLNHVRKTKVAVTIFLINGVKLQGVITWFDSFCVLLRRDGQSQLVYKSAISTIMPAQPINLYDGDE